MQWTEKNPQRVGNYSPEVWCESKTKVNILGCIAKPKVLWIKSCAGLFFCKYLYWGLSMLAHRVGVETESLFWLQYKLEHTGQTPDAGDGQSPYTVVYGSSWSKVSSTSEMCVLCTTAIIEIAHCSALQDIYNDFGCTQNIYIHCDIGTFWLLE